jgi:AhpD family alkylhydroperoxidase
MFTYEEEITMKLRMRHAEVQPGALEAMMKLETFARESGLDPVLYELIKIRASQINGCSYCVDMHVTDTLRLGVAAEKIYLLPVWKESPYYTDKERAVLALTEALTRISENGVPDALYEEVMKHVTEVEYVNIIMAVNAINGWNRIGIATGMFPGCSLPAAKA